MQVDIRASGHRVLWSAMAAEVKYSNLFLNSLEYAMSCFDGTLWFAFI